MKIANGMVEFNSISNAMYRRLFELDVFSQREKSELIKLIHYWQQVLAPIPIGKQRAEFAIAKVDETIKLIKLKQKPSITCHKGCSYCCYGMVTCTHSEAKYLAGKIRSKRVTLNRERLAEQRHWHAERWIEDRGAPCIFLTEKGECGAYKHRPLACRLHHSKDDLSKCENDEEHMIWNPAGADAILCALMDLESNYDKDSEELRAKMSLPFMIARELGT